MKTIADFLDEVKEREQIAKTLFDLVCDSDYLNLCLVSCGGLQVHEIYMDSYIGNKL